MLLNFWLKPQQAVGEDLGRESPSPTPSNLIGTLLIFIAYGFMIAIFQAIAK